MPKNVWLTSILSAIIPGLGQAYNGEVFKGIIVLFAFWITFFLSGVAGVFIFFAFIIWIFGIYDAYSIAKKMNLGEIPYLETSARNIIIFFAIPIAIVIILVLFSYIMLGSGFFTTQKSVEILPGSSTSWKDVNVVVQETDNGFDVSWLGGSDINEIANWRATENSNVIGEIDTTPSISERYSYTAGSIKGKRISIFATFKDGKEQCLFDGQF